MANYKTCVKYQMDLCPMARNFANNPEVRLDCSKCEDYACEDKKCGDCKHYDAQDAYCGVNHESKFFRGNTAACNNYEERQEETNMEEKEKKNVASVKSHRNGGHSCGECRNFGNKLPLKCAYRGVNHPACDEFEPKEPIIDPEMIRDAETVPVVTENAEPKKCENCFWYCRTCHNKESAFYGDVMGKSGYCVHHDYKSGETNMNPEQPAHDAVSHPSHYCKGSVECLDAIKAALGDKYEGFLAGNVLKYVYRYPDKNGVEDCKKARFYLDKLIEVLSDEKT